MNNDEKNKQTADEGEVIVNITEHAYNPSELTIKSGQRVTFINNDPDEHTATAMENLFDKEIKPGESATIDFNLAGTYDYYCRYHPDMQGTIVVED